MLIILYRIDRESPIYYISVIVLEKIKMPVFSVYRLIIRKLVKMPDLTILTDESQRALAFLLLLPVGVLITAVLSGILGLRTTGVFTPTILGLNLARSDWRVGVIIFIATFAIGSAGRSLLIRLNLSTITRRGIIATVSVMLFAVLVVVNEEMQIGLKPGAVVLPVVILTLMIDRFFGIIQKEGNRAAWFILGNTIVVTLCCFAVFEFTPAERWFLKFPLLVVVVLCGLIWIGVRVREPLRTIPPKPVEAAKIADSDD